MAVTTPDEGKSDTVRLAGGMTGESLGDGRVRVQFDDTTLEVQTATGHDGVIYPMIPPCEPTNRPEHK